MDFRSVLFAPPDRSRAHAMRPYVVALGVLMAGCSAPAGPGTPSLLDTPAATPGQELSCEPGKEHWRSNATPKRGQTMVVTSTGVDHMDVTAAGRNNLHPQVYNGLVEYRGCFPEDVALNPSLASSWEVSPDGLSWTFKLRDDVRWHNKPPVNGRAFTSADVAWTIEHQKAQGILGSTWKPIEHREPDPHTVVLQVKAPDADLLSKMGSHQNLVVAREVKEQDGDFKKTAVGTGAFMVKEFKPGQDFLLDRNPDYYGMGQDGKRLPYVDQVRAVVFPDRAAEVAALRTGQLDLTNSFAVITSEVDTMSRVQPKLQYFRQLQPVAFTVWFNHKRAPWDNPKLRKAVSLSFDPDDVVESYGGDRGGVRSGFVPPAFQEFAWSQEQHKERYRRDIEQAKKLVAEAGYAPGQLKPVFITIPNYQQQAEIVLEGLKAIGVDARLEVVPNHLATMQQGAYDLAWGGQQSRLFVSFWVGDLFRTASTLNESGVSDAVADQLIDAQAREMNPAARKQLVDQLQGRLYDITASVPVVSSYYHLFVSCRIRNWKPLNSSYNTSNAVTGWLDEEGCR